MLVLLIKVVVLYVIRRTAILVILNGIVRSEGLAAELVQQAVLQRDDKIGSKVVDTVLVLTFHIDLYKNVVNAVFQQLFVLRELVAVVVEHLNIQIV